MGLLRDIFCIQRMKEEVGNFSYSCCRPEHGKCITYFGWLRGQFSSNTQEVASLNTDLVSDDSKSHYVSEKIAQAT